MTTLTNEVRKLADTKPFYAVAGCGDLAVEKLRGFSGRLAEVQDRLQDVAYDRTGLQQRAMEYAGSLGYLASSTYDDLAERGRGLVSRSREQDSAQDSARVGRDRPRTRLQQAEVPAAPAGETADTARPAASDSVDQAG